MPLRFVATFGDLRAKIARMISTPGSFRALLRRNQNVHLYFLVAKALLLSLVLLYPNIVPLRAQIAMQRNKPFGSSKVNIQITGVDGAATCSIQGPGINGAMQVVGNHASLPAVPPGKDYFSAVCVSGFFSFEGKTNITVEAGGTSTATIPVAKPGTRNVIVTFLHSEQPEPASGCEASTAFLFHGHDLVLMQNTVNAKCTAWFSDIAPGEYTVTATMPNQENLGVANLSVHSGETANVVVKSLYPHNVNLEWYQDHAVVPCPDCNTCFDCKYSNASSPKKSAEQ